MAKGGSEIIVGGDFKSDAQGDSFVSNGFYYRSSVDLQDSTLKVGGSFSAYRSNISLTGNSSIHANSFFLDKTASLNFIGSDTGFSFINATTSATFNGSVTFQLTGSLLKNDDISYLILDTPLLQGSTLREGKVTVLDSTGQTLTNYITEIVKKDDQYLLAFCDVNTGCSSDEGGDTGDGEQGGSGNEGSGGDNQGGNSGSDDKPITPSPNTPPSSDPIYNAIYEALDGSIINNDNIVRTAASTVEKQIETIQDERKTYQGNLIHHNMLGRIANNLNKPKYAFNTKSKFASLTSDYKPYVIMSISLL